jgi:hypothetical protein
MGVTAMAVSFVVVPLVSLLTKNTEAEKVRIENLFACCEKMKKA